MSIDTYLQSNNDGRQEHTIESSNSSISDDNGNSVNGNPHAERSIILGSRNGRNAIDINIIKDEDIVSNVASDVAPESKDDIVEVIEIVFDDNVRWQWPLKEWDKDYARIRRYMVEKYGPEVLKHYARKNGEDPEEQLNNSIFVESDNSIRWVEEIEQTDMSADDRAWFNRHAEWMPKQMKKVEKDDSTVDVEIDTDSSWEDDW